MSILLGWCEWAEFLKKQKQKTQKKTKNNKHLQTNDPFLQWAKPLRRQVVREWESLLKALKEELALMRTQRGDIQRAVGQLKIIRDAVEIEHNCLTHEKQAMLPKPPP